MVADEDLLHCVERAGADVAEDDPGGPKRQKRRVVAVREMVARRCGRSKGCGHVMPRLSMGGGPLNLVLMHIK